MLLRIFRDVLRRSFPCLHLTRTQFFAGRRGSGRVFPAGCRSPSGSSPSFGSIRPVAMVVYTSMAPAGLSTRAHSMSACGRQGHASAYRETRGSQTARPQKEALRWDQRTVRSSPLPFPDVPLRRRLEAERRGPSAARGGFPASPRRRQPLRGKSLQR